MTDINAIQKAIEVAGGLSALASKLGIKPPSVHEWKARGRIPAERVLDIEAATGVTRYELRPDIYGAAPPKRGKKPATHSSSEQKAA